jgi:hypothetical protein
MVREEVETEMGYVILVSKFVSNSIYFSGSQFDAVHG